MESLYIFLFLFSMSINDPVFFMPRSDIEVRGLIDRLGDDDYFVREDADRLLRGMGWRGLRGCWEYSGVDEEIKRRVFLIYDSYFELSVDDNVGIPPIWCLDNSLRYPSGYDLKLSILSNGSLCKWIHVGDIGDYYFRKTYNPSYFYPPYWDNNLSRLATVLYFRDQLRMGVSRGEVKSRLNRMVWNYYNQSNYLQTRDLSLRLSYDYYTLPPGPLLPKKDFKQPSECWNYYP